MVHAGLYGQTRQDGDTGGGDAGRTLTNEGGTGTGKTLVGLHVLVEGARRGEPGILFTREETPAQIRAVAKSFGWDLAPLEAEGRLLISYTSPVEHSTDRFLGEAQGRSRGSARAARCSTAYQHVARGAFAAPLPRSSMP